MYEPKYINSANRIASVSKPILTEPFHATKLWNDCVRSFYNGVPLSRHWRGLRQYDNCFTASEAVTWLHSHLKSNPNFGPSVSREQTVKLLRKFLKSGLIIEARGKKINPDDFRENRELFKFGDRSPLKALRTPRRTALASLSTNVLNHCNASDNGSSPLLIKQNDWNNAKCLKENAGHRLTDKEIFNSVAKTVNPETVNEIWKEIFFYRLEEISEQLMVGGDGSSPIINMSSINSSWIRHNMTRLIPKGLVENDNGMKQKNSLKDLPDWIFSAMKCLANWPNSSESVCNIPNYPGVEFDVFKVVRDFFASMVIPLIPYELYDPLVRLYIGSEFLDIMHRSPSDSTTSVKKLNYSDDQASLPLSATDSVEDLMLDISMSAKQHSTPCTEDDNNSIRSQVLSTSNFIMEKQNKVVEAKIQSLEHRTPKMVQQNLTHFVPKSLELNKLRNYTNFKESYLYSHCSCNGSDLSADKSLSSHNSSTMESLNRRTLKALKNKSKKIDKAKYEVQNISNSNTHDFPLLFRRLLKTEELDNFRLPPNSCFETAFTSDSPKTRIIPQKSVDTIHFRNALRPKSVAVSSFMHELKSCNNLGNTECLKQRPYRSTDPKSLNDNLHVNQRYVDSSALNRSHSEGNLQNYFVDSFDNISPPDGFKVGYPLSRSAKVENFASKNRFAARLRDSIKRKKARDSMALKMSGDRNKQFVHHMSKSYSQSDSMESLLSKNGEFSSADLQRLKIRSGGYRNIALSMDSCNSLDNLSGRSSSSEPHHYDNTGKFASLINGGFSQSKETLNELEELHANTNIPVIREPSDSPLSLCHIDGHPSSEKWKRHDTYRSKSATPDGCLSHSYASSFGNSMYHSALSRLSQTSLPYTSHAACVSLGLTKANKREIIHENETPPTLPKRAPVIKENCHDWASGLLLHDYENVLDLSNVSTRVLSSSANELSDTWVDRTPFGRVPPYVQVGLWRHYHSSPSKRLIRQHNGLKKFYGKKACLPGLLTRAGKESCIEALQYIILLLDPNHRKKLHLLLRMMSKVSANYKLQLDKDTTNRALMVQTFVRSVLLSEKERDYDEILAIRILTFMMDNHNAVFTPPQHLAVLVHRKINYFAKLKSVPEVLAEAGNQFQPDTFCVKVSPEAYEREKLTGSQQFLAELLDQIIDNPKLSQKEKRKKLKEFRHHYPEIYSRRFPPGKENEVVVFEHQKKRMKRFKKFSSLKNLARTKSFRI